MQRSFTRIALEKYRLISLIFILIFNLNTFAQDDPPSDCGCGDDYHPTLEEAAYNTCLEERGCANGYDVPVDGNVWVLMIAGAVLFVAKRKFLDNKS